MVVRFFTSENDYSQQDTIKNHDMLIADIRRRNEVMAAFRTSETEAATEEGVPPVSFSPRGRALSAIGDEPEPELMDGSISVSSSDEGD